MFNGRDNIVFRIVDDLFGCLAQLIAIIFATIIIIIVVAVIFTKKEVKTSTPENNANTDTVILHEKKWELNIIDGAWVIDSAQNQ